MTAPIETALIDSTLMETAPQTAVPGTALLETARAEAVMAQAVLAESMLARSVPDDAAPTAHGPGLSVVLSSVASDSHTWNLVYLQLVLEELGHRVVNLGACVPDDLLIDECLRSQPDLVVISTVNGHGFIDGSRLIARIRALPELADTPVAIGGMLGINGPDGQRSKALLLAAGYTAVFDSGARLPAFRSFLARLTTGVAA